jgi:hypothetical protein
LSALAQHRLSRLQRLANQGRSIDKMGCQSLGVGPVGGSRVLHRERLDTKLLQAPIVVLDELRYACSESMWIGHLPGAHVNPCRLVGICRPDAPLGGPDRAFPSRSFACAVQSTVGGQNDVRSRTDLEARWPHVHAN